ncbi:MAG: EamA family transporter, partial [Methanobacterium sp.]|nr:EamA family transporter [Methanobacterium sp.]
MSHSILCALLWATTGVVVRLIHGVPVANILLGRFVIAGCVIILAARVASPRQGCAQGKPAMRRRMTLCALSFVMVLYYVCATYSFLFAPVALATLLMSLSPCVSIVYGVLRKEQVRIAEMAGSLLSFLGVVLFVWPSLHHGGADGRGLIPGCALAFSAAVLKAVNAEILWRKKDWFQPDDFGVLNKATFLIGALVILPFCSFDAALATVQGHTPILFLVLGVLSTALPSILNNMAALRAGPVIHSVIGLSTPLLAGAMAWPLLGDPVSAWSACSRLGSLAG